MGLYSANFHTQSYRSGRPPNAIRFAAATDGAAAAIAAEIGTWTLGQLTSLYAKKFFNNVVPYPVGTRQTGNFLVSDATGRVQRVRIRNVNALLTAADITALFTGVVGATGIGAGFTALSAPPLTAAGRVITSVASDAILTKY